MTDGVAILTVLARRVGGEIRLTHNVIRRLVVGRRQRLPDQHAIVGRVGDCQHLAVIRNAYRIAHLRGRDCRLRINYGGLLIRIVADKIGLAEHYGCAGPRRPASRRRSLRTRPKAIRARRPVLQDSVVRAGQPRLNVVINQDPVIVGRAALAVGVGHDQRPVGIGQALRGAHQRLERFVGHGGDLVGRGARGDHVLASLRRESWLPDHQAGGLAGAVLRLGGGRRRVVGGEVLAPVDDAALHGGGGGLRRDGSLRGVCQRRDRTRSGRCDRDARRLRGIDGSGLRRAG